MWARGQSGAGRLTATGRLTAARLPAPGFGLPDGEESHLLLGLSQSQGKPKGSPAPTMLSCGEIALLPVQVDSTAGDFTPKAPMLTQAGGAAEVGPGGRPGSCSGVEGSETEVRGAELGVGKARGGWGFSLLMVPG